jgi:hypothetical protein
MFALSILLAWECQSVKGRSSPMSEWEFVLYDPTRIIDFLDFECMNPNPGNFRTELRVLDESMEQNRILERASRRGCKLDLISPDKVLVKETLDESGRPGLDLCSRTGEPIECGDMEVRGTITVRGASLHVTGKLVLGPKPPVAARRPDKRRFDLEQSSEDD